VIDGCWNQAGQGQKHMASMMLQRARSFWYRPESSEAS
jgi:hypothetical protein